MPGLFAVGLVSVAASALLVACGSPQPAPVTDPGRVGIALGPERPVDTKTTLPLAGARCTGGACRCRDSLVAADIEETTPPAEGSKRLELRMSADGGVASVEIAGLGTLGATGGADVCAYVDVPAGSVHDLSYIAKESVKGQGVAPRLRIAEYGPKGPYWYDMINIVCDGPGGRCDRNAADAWGALVRQRKRGRLDPCGSGVITKLGWDTSGSEASREGGLFRDLAVRFTMELKKFATQSPPNSTECVPK